MYCCGVHSCRSLAVGGPADQDPTGRRGGLPRWACARQRPARQARDHGVARRRGTRPRGRHGPRRRGGTGDPEKGRRDRRGHLLHRPDTRPTTGDSRAGRPPGPGRRTTHETRTPDTRQVPQRSTLTRLLARITRRHGTIREAVVVEVDGVARGRSRRRQYIRDRGHLLEQCVGRPTAQWVSFRDDDERAVRA